MVKEHSSYECKVLGDFSIKYAKVRPTKYLRQEPVTNNNFGSQQENNAIIQHAFDEIIPQQNKKISVKYETHENMNDQVDEDELYKLNKKSLDENK